jgi:hypothetical protein
VRCVGQENEGFDCTMHRMRQQVNLLPRASVVIYFLYYCDILTKKDVKFCLLSVVELIVYLAIYLASNIA